MDTGVKITFDGTTEFSAQIDALSRTHVFVGVPEVKAARQDDSDAGPINNAALAYIHENGAPEVNIPARPFLRPTVRESRELIERSLQRAGDLAFEGKPFNAELNRLGMRMVTAVRKKIIEGPFVPLAPATLRMRRARGRTGTAPLIDTGQLKNAISYVIEHGAKERS